MIAEKTNVPALLDYLDVTTIKVHAPTQVIFVCGGVIGDVRGSPKSLRDAFMRIFDETPLAKHHLVLAEDENFSPPKGEYEEILQFESDIAQIAELLLLFSESEGSFAELGAFVVDQEVAPRMMVVVDNIHHDKDSFIKWGPLYTLKVHWGEESVCVVNLPEINLTSLSGIANIDLTKFAASLKNPLKTRLAMRREPSTFDPKRRGHVTKLITGLIQHYAALTILEIELLLGDLKIPTAISDIRKHLMCAEIFGWIASSKRGFEIYYAAVAPGSAINFEVYEGLKKPNLLGWRSDILSYWKKNETERSAAIAEAAARSVK